MSSDTSATTAASNTKECPFCAETMQGKDQRPPYERDECEQAIAEVRSALVEKAFAAAFAQGRAMPGAGARLRAGRGR
jgi:hypothetical protein